MCVPEIPEVGESGDVGDGNRDGYQDHRGRKHVRYTVTVTQGANIHVLKAVLLSNEQDTVCP